MDSNTRWVICEIAKCEVTLYNSETPVIQIYMLQMSLVYENGLSHLTMGEQWVNYYPLCGLSTILQVHIDFHSSTSLYS